MTQVFHPAGDDWESLRQQIVPPDMRAETDIHIALLADILHARQESGMTQKQLESASGVKQPVITRLERGVTDPQLSTVMRLLAAMGKTLAVVPLHNQT